MAENDRVDLIALARSEFEFFMIRLKLFSLETEDKRPNTTFALNMSLNKRKMKFTLKHPSDSAY